MAEYIEREALLKDISESVVFTVRGDKPSLEIRGANKVINRIKSAPTADVVEVVRCKDCTFSREMDKYEKHLYFDTCVGCTKHSESYYSLIMDSDDFCSYGERKEGANND